MYVVVVGFVGAGLWHQDIKEYLPFLISGMVAWVLVSTIITEACSLLISSHALFRNVTFEYSILAYALVWRNLIVFLHDIVVYVLIVGLLRPEPDRLHGAPGDPRLVMLVGIERGVDRLAVRNALPEISRSHPAGLFSLIQISMLITPIFWPPDSLSGYRRLIFVETNPLYHMVDIVRAPLLGVDARTYELCGHRRDHGLRVVFDLCRIAAIPQAHRILELNSAWRGWCWKMFAWIF